MDMKSLAQDLSVLRTVAERFSRNLPANTAVWNNKTQLAAGTQDALMMIDPEEEIPLKGVVNLDRFYTACRALTTGHVVARPAGIAVLGSGTRDEIEFLDKVEPNKFPAGAPFEERSTPVRLGAEALEYVSLAMSDESTRYALCSIFFDSKNGMIVASDGKRLHWRPFQSEKKFPPVLLPDKGAMALLAAMKRENLPLKRLRLSSESKDEPAWASFLVQRSILYARLTQGHFPDWKAVLPGPFTLEVRFDADRFRSAAKDIMAFVRGGKKGAASYFDVNAHGGVDLVGFREPGGTRRARLTVLSHRGQMKALHRMAFNPKYLFEGSWNDQETVIQVAGHSKAMAMDGCAIVMPLAALEGVPEAARAARDAEGLHATLQLSKSEPICTWRKRAVQKIKDPLTEEPAPKSIPAPVPARKKADEVPVAEIPTRFEELRKAVEAPDPLPDKRQRCTKTEWDRKEIDKQYDFLLFS